MKRLHKFLIFLFIITLTITITIPSAFAAVNNQLDESQFRTILDLNTFNYGLNTSGMYMSVNSEMPDKDSPVLYSRMYTSNIRVDGSMKNTFPLSIYGSDSFSLQGFVAFPYSLSGYLNNLTLDSVVVFHPDGSNTTLSDDKYSFNSGYLQNYVIQSDINVSSLGVVTVTKVKNMNVRFYNIFIEKMDVDYITLNFSFNNSSKLTFSSSDPLFFGLSSLGVSTSNNAVFDNILSSIQQIPDKINQSVEASKENGGLIIKYGDQIYNSIEDIKTQNSTVINQNEQMIANQSTIIHMTPDGQLAVDELQSTFDETQKKIDEILEALKVEQPPPKDIIINNVTDISQDYDVELVTNTFASLFQSNIVVTLMIGALTFCLIGYVLYGKKA